MSTEAFLKTVTGHSSQQQKRNLPVVHLYPINQTRKRYFMMNVSRRDVPSRLKHHTSFPLVVLRAYAYAFLLNK